VSEPASSPAARRVDRLFVEKLGNGVILEMAAVPGGEFAMGAPADEPDSSDSERPRHRVSVPGFHMGRCPVTVAQWTAVMADVPDAMQRLDRIFAAGERQPVVRVSWDDADAFCARLSATTGRPYRLPT
jgi:formylglycine-generating enzyme required for sulfatase activity